MPEVTQARLGRVCRALGLQKIQRMPVVDSRAPKMEMIYPPIHESAEWAVRAMEAAAAILRERKESLDYTIESYPDGWEVLPCHFVPDPRGGSRETDWTWAIDEATFPHRPFPAAVFLCLEQAVEAGAIGGDS